MRWIGLAVALWLGGATGALADKAYVAGGCFWCVEADFEKVPGVRGVVSGYTGGTSENPTYAEVSADIGGHYEAVEIDFDPERISYAAILYLFFRSINPTDAGGQFCDRGDSYRTAIFVTDEGQRLAAEAAVAAAGAALGKRIRTPVLAAGRFWPAEDVHQDYWKGREIVLTRRGPMRKADAYRFYRAECGRDRRLIELWGDAAVFSR
jgi:peptide-methionine (S)-S-oxide reductase